MADNYIYAPAHNIEGGFRCRVPLKGSRQIFMIDGGVQGTGRPLDIRFEKGRLYEEALQVIGIRTEKHPEDILMESRFHFAEGSSAKLILCSHRTSTTKLLTTPHTTSGWPGEPRSRPSSSPFTAE